MLKSVTKIGPNKIPTIKILPDFPDSLYSVFILIILLKHLLFIGFSVSSALLN